MARKKLVEFDFICKRYGLAPHKLKDADIEDFQFTLLVASMGADEEMKAHKTALKNSKAGSRKGK